MIDLSTNPILEEEPHDQLEIPVEIGAVALRVSGTVEHGFSATFKPPTINIVPKFKVPGGFYTGHAYEGEKHLGQALILSRPFAERQGLEAYISGFSGDLYDKEVTLAGIQRITAEQLAHLIDQLLMLMPIHLPGATPCQKNP